MENNEGMVKIRDKEYPELLRKLKGESPKQLYYKGDVSLLQKDCLAVVGSRRITTYGKQVVEKIVGQIASCGIVIVSGFMYGVDATAHKAAVDVGGKTIAVMPCGINLVHPEYQIKLYNDIIESGGLIVSEYEGDLQPALYTYPARNRIVAGISKAVLVVEAAEKSGSLITANLAKKFKRKLFAVPGPIASIVSQGTNNLIKRGEAKMVTSAEDILKYFSCKSISEKPCPLGSREAKPFGLEGRILELLQAEPLQLDVLARKLQKPVAELSVEIFQMEIKGLIKKENNKYYVF